MTKRIFRLVHAQARSGACQAIKDAPDGFTVVIDEPRRSLEANAAQWPILQAFADQKQLCINGAMQNVTADDWKDVLTAVFEADMRVAVFQGRMILLGQRTREFSKKKFSDWLEFLNATAVEMEVNLNWSE